MTTEALQQAIEMLADAGAYDVAEAAHQELTQLLQVRVCADEAARLTGYDKSHVHHLIRAGTLRAAGEGWPVRIPLAAIEALPPRGRAGRPRRST